MVSASFPMILGLAILAPGPAAGPGSGEGPAGAPALAAGSAGNAGADLPPVPASQAVDLRWKADSGHVWIYNNTTTCWLVEVQEGEGLASSMPLLHVRIPGGDPVWNRRRVSIVNQWRGKKLRLQSGWSLVLEKAPTWKLARKRSWKDFACTLRPEHATGQEHQVRVRARRTGAGTGSGPEDDLFYDFQWPAASGITRVVRTPPELVVCLGGDVPAVAAPDQAGSQAPSSEPRSDGR